MRSPAPSKADVIAMMRRLGMHDRIDEARRDLPERIDLDRDGDKLRALGLGVDSIVNELGGSPI